MSILTVEGRENPLTASEMARAVIAKGEALGTLHAKKLNERFQDEREEYLLDQFAAAALTGLLADGEWVNVGEKAYGHADSCMAERRKRMYRNQCEADLQKEQSK